MVIDNVNIFLLQHKCSVNKCFDGYDGILHAGGTADLICALYNGNVGLSINSVSKGTRV